MAAEQTDVLVSIHSIVILALEQLFFTYLCFLLRPVEVVSQLDTGIEETNAACVSEPVPPKGCATD